MQTTKATSILIYYLSPVFNPQQEHEQTTLSKYPRLLIEETISGMQEDNSHVEMQRPSTVCERYKLVIAMNKISQVWKKRQTVRRLTVEDR